MGKITEEASATVTLNMEPARKSLDEAKASAKAFREELETLLSVPEGERSLDQKLRIGRLTENIAKADKEIEKAEKKLTTFRDTLNNLNGASFNELYKASKELESQIKRLKPGTEEYIAANHDLKMVNTRLDDLRKGWKAVKDETEKTVKETKESVSVMDKLSKGFQKYWSMFDVAMRTVTGLSMKFRQCAEDAAKLDDVYADVMKTTSLLHEEVEGLDKELMQIDTRTSREQLLLLARDAGKLGIQGKENILGFVRAADQIQVALGEDLGEGAIKNLGKIADVFGLTKEMGIEKSLLSIASAVNALGQASTASEAYLVDFTQRLAGVGAMAGLSVQDILGFASGLDQSAMKVEMAATAFQKFLMKMYEDTATFAGYANMEVEEFSELLKTNANEAITTVMKAMNGQDGFASLVPMFDQMGLDGARAVTVLASMTQNLEAVTEAQRLANEEFAKGTSVTEEYTVKNNNLQAQLEKARKEFLNASIALGQSLNPIMLKSTKATTYLIRALANYGKEIKTVLVVIAALTVALKAKVIWMKVVATWNATLRTGSLALAAAQALLAGNVTRAAAAWKLMNTAMKASVIGVAIAAISGLVIWLQKLNKETEQLTELQKFEKQLTEEVANATSNEASRVKALKSIVEDSNQAYQERKLALQELKRIVPDYHADLTEEGVLINNNTEALDNYINAMLKAAKAKVLQDKLMENANKQFEQQQYLTENAPADFRDELGNWRRTYSEAGPERDNGTSGIITHWISQDCEAAIDRLEEFKKEEELILDMIRKTDASSLSDIGNGGENNGGSGNGGSGDNSKDAEKRYQKALKDLEMHQREELNILNQSYFDKKITAEEHEKQLRDITMKYLQEKLQLARDNGKDTTQIEAAILKEQMANRKADYDNALKQLQDCQKDEENALAMSLAAQEITEKEYQSQMLEVRMRYLQEKLKLAAENGEDETAVLQAILDAQLEAQKAANDEMAKLKEEAKKVIAETDPSSARKSELEEQLKRLEILHDAELLSEEQYEERVKQLRKKYADEDLRERLANVQKVNDIMEQASNFVTALKEAESAKLEAQYQADLTAAGDNAEKREEIEANYQKQQLDLQKKYADADMAIKIAKTTAAGAVAAIRAYEEGGPYAGIALAAMIALTTAAEIATIVEQRNAIKNTSPYSSSSNGTSSTNTDGLETGTRHITGYGDGGFTENHTTLTTVGERGVEWVAPHWMVSENPVTFANLEQYRRLGSFGRSGSISRGFADGGFTGNNVSESNFGNMVSKSDIEAAVESAIRNSMSDGAIRAYLVWNDLMELYEQHLRFKNQTTR